MIVQKFLLIISRQTVVNIITSCKLLMMWIWPPRVFALLELIHVLGTKPVQKYYRTELCNISEDIIACFLQNSRCNLIII